MNEVGLYHIHRYNENNRLWVPGKTIHVTPDWMSGMYKQYINFHQTITISNYQVSGVMLFSDWLDQTIFSLNQYSVLNRQQIMALKDILEKAKILSDYADIFKREQALESYRQKYFPDLPSRLHSLYLCDEAGLEYWKKTLDSSSDMPSKKSHIFKVKVNGRVFKTDEQLLPMEVLNYQDTYEGASLYWNPTHLDSHKESVEYLAQGEVQILKRIN